MDLPVESLRGPLIEALARGPVVLTAPTGSGKSTRVPTWCLEEGRCVLVVEPRRVACRSLARFVASRAGAALGREVGYRHRHENRTSPDTRLVYATPGTALRMMHAGEIGRFDVLVVDEFHERHIQVDLFMALARSGLCPAPMVVMSATMDAAALARWLSAPVLEAEGRVHPVEIEHDASVSVPTTRGLEERVVHGLESCLAHPGDVLAFLPGKSEISAVRSRLGSRRDLDVVILHGGLAARDQDRAFEPGDTRRVVLATNVAESAVTIPRIGVVLDSGLERRTVWRDGRSVLELAVISRASADQRAGRAGRLAPGRALRLWSPAARLEERTPPEIHRADLMELVLESAAAGARARSLPFPDPPRPYALEDAERRLLCLGAVDDSCAITDTGREMMRLALDPPLARVLVEARRRGDAVLLQDVVDLVASLSAGRGILLPPDGRDPPPGREEISEAGCDFVARILAMRRGEPGRHGLRAGPLAEAREVARRLRLTLELDGTDRGPSSRLGLARTVVRAWPESAYVPHARSGAFGNGRDEVVLGRESLVPPGARALVVLEKRSVRKGRGRTVTLVTCASPVDLDLLVELGVGEERLVDARLVDGILVAVIERRHAGRVIGTAEAEPGPDRAAEAATVVVWGSRVLPGAAERLRDDVGAWDLSIALGRTRGDPVDPRAWLENRLRELGVRSGADLDLVGADDLVFTGLGEKERALLDREFPRRIHLGEQEIGVEYEVDARQAILTHLAGARRVPPPSRLLPPWPGWGVVYRDRGRSTRIR